MSSLYEVAKELLACIKMTDDEYVNEDAGEVIDIEQIEQLQMTFESKVENIGRWIKNLISDAEAIKVEEKKLASRRKALENKASSLKQYLEICMNGKVFSSPTVQITWRNSTSVDVNLDELMKYDDCDSYLKYTEPTPDKMAIKNAIKGGKEIPGCVMVSKENMQIK